MHTSSVIMTAAHRQKKKKKNLTENLASKLNEMTVWYALAEY